MTDKLHKRNQKNVKQGESIETRLVKLKENLNFTGHYWRWMFFNYTKEIFSGNNKRTDKFF